MRTLAVTSLTAVALLAAAPPSVAASPSIDQIVADAQKVRIEAREVKALLKDRAADPVVVQQRLTVIEAHAQSLKSAIAAMRASDTSLTSTQVAALERAQAAAETLLVLLDNKSTMVADAAEFQRKRGLLRAKADGIAQRAEIVEKQMAVLRS
jgi:hypothetical protein